MVEVELLKDMQNGAKGTVLTVSAPRAYYWKRMGVSKDYVKPKAKPKKEKENDKSGTTNKGKGKSKS